MVRHWNRLPWNVVELPPLEVSGPGSGLCGLVVGGWLDWMILQVSSNFDVL